MADLRKYIQAQEFTLAGSGVTSSATSIILKSFKLPEDNTGTETNITTTDIGTLAYGVLEPNTAREETISFTTITQNADGTATLSGVTRGLDFVDTYATDSTRQFAHAGGTKFILSNPAAFYANFANKNNDETIAETWTFTTSDFPKMSDSTTNPTNDEDLVPKHYVDGIALGGSTNIDRIVVPGTAGETVADGELLYFDTVTNNEWMLADADTAAKIENVQLGIAQGAGTDGNAITGGVLLLGVDDAQSGLTAGDLMYASDTAGAISSSVGTKEVTVGIAKSATELYFNPRLNQQITEDEQDALAGTSGTPTTNNKYVTDNDTTDDDAQVSAVVQDSTVAVGEADATTKNNKLAQSFTATRTSVTGVRYHKAADTGSFTGTVTFSLQADDGSGDPSGSALATVTVSNGTWTGLSTGVNTATFGTPYSSAVPGTTYHIVVETSTADTSNHPNLGSDSGAGYAGGSLQANNTTDGWTAETDDLYFEVLTDPTGKILRLNSSDLVHPDFLSLTTQGDMLYHDANGLARLAAGTADQFLQMNDAATAPEWGSPTFVGSQQTGTYWTYPLYLEASEIVSSGTGTLAVAGPYMSLDSSANTLLAYLPLLGTGSQIEYRWTESKDLIVQWRGLFTLTGDASFMGVSNMTGAFSAADLDHAAGFAYNGGTLKSWSDDGSTIESNDIAGVTATNWNTYRIEVTLGTSVKFYVNGTLKFTHSTNIPTAGNGRFGGNQASGSGGNLNYISLPIVSLEV